MRWSSTVTPAWLVTVSLLVAAISSQMVMDPFSGPYIYEQPEDFLVAGTQEVTLKCGAKGYPNLNHEWYTRWGVDTEMRPLYVDSFHMMDKYDGSLTISIASLGASDGWNKRSYQCVVSNIHGTVKSRVANVDFGSLAEFSNVPPSPVNAQEYMPAQLQCPYIDAYPGKTFFWFKDSDSSRVVHQSFDPNVFVSTDGRLFFSNITAQDEGVYSCVVTLSALGTGYKLLDSGKPLQRVSLGIRLVVNASPPSLATPSNEEPQILQGFASVHPYQYYPLVKENVTLQCFAFERDSQPYQYWWTRTGMNGKEYDLSPDHFVLSDRSRTLTIVHTLLEHSGYYTCHVKGEYGQVTSKVEVMVQSKPLFEDRKGEHFVREGEKLVLDCFPYAEPKPEISWYKDGMKVEEYYAHTMYESGSQLVINTLSTDEHSGMYQCEATNYLGTSYSTAQVSFESVYGPDDSESGASDVTSSSIMVVMGTALACFLWATSRRF